MSELGIMLAAGALAEARQAEACETGRVASTADLIRQAVALLSGRSGAGGQPGRWVALPV